MVEIICAYDGCLGQDIRARGLCNQHYFLARKLGTIHLYALTTSEVRHTLSNVDLEARLAVCAVCGPVTLRGKSTKRPRCSVKAVQYRAGLEGVDPNRVGCTKWSDLEKFNNGGWVVDGNGCWNWLGGVLESGYGYCPTNSFGTRRAHRLSYQLRFGRIASSVPVHHKCANRQCVNPEHLQAVTHAENTAEMMERNNYIREIASLKEHLLLLQSKL